MSYFIINTVVLPSTIQRKRQYSKKAMEKLSPLFDLLASQKDLKAQLNSLNAASDHDQLEISANADAVEAWANLIRGHALDFHADAGENGSVWQNAAIDAWQMWLLIRRGASIDASWPWEWSVKGMTGKGKHQNSDVSFEPKTPVEYDDPNLKIQIKELTLQDWDQALKDRSNQLAVQETLALYKIWPNIDLPSLAIAVGALWALSVIGPLSGFTSLSLSGIGEEESLDTVWNS